jgi:hypothetical protein
MEHLTLPSIGASFKKWRSCTPILPNFPKNKFNSIQKKGTRPDRLGIDLWRAVDLQLRPGRGRATRPRPLGASSPETRGCRPRVDWRPPVTRRPCVDAWLVGLYSLFLNFFRPALHFLRMWSTLAGWLQHMPALTRPCPKSSNTHTF